MRKKLPNWLQRVLICVAAVGIAFAAPAVAQPPKLEGIPLSPAQAAYARGCLSWLGFGSGTPGGNPEYKAAASTLNGKLKPSTTTRNEGGQVTYTYATNVSRNCAFTLPEYTDAGGIQHYLNVPFNEIMICGYDWGGTLTGPMYLPPALLVPPSTPNPYAAEIALASVLFHELQHCWQTRDVDPDARPTCDGLRAHIKIHDQQLEFLDEARPLLANQPMSQSDREIALEQLDKYIEWVEQEKRTLQEMLNQRINANDCE